MDAYTVTGRRFSLFEHDISRVEAEIKEIVESSSFLVIGAAGTIGQATSREIFKRNPRRLCAVDISENNLVELVRDLRSTVGYGTGELETRAIDCGSLEFKSFIDNSEPFDFVLNFSALKHVRSESDPYTLMRLVRTNVLNTISIYNSIAEQGTQKYFCVSTDKAANPVNMMGASKRIMELFMMREMREVPVSMARFANVAYSDGSLLHGFKERFEKFQPISAPRDVRRYFVSKQESGELCLLSTLYGESLDVYFPKLSEELHLTRFSDVARTFIESRGFGVYECVNEQEARDRVSELVKKKLWPCYFFDSDTTGEKDFEEFFTADERIDWEKYRAIGVIKNSVDFDAEALIKFEEGCSKLLSKGAWSKTDLLELFYAVLPCFEHLETGRYLNERM